MLLINAVNAEGRPVELYVKDGKIAAVGQDLAALAGENETVLDAGGLTVLPAFVDLHCHWRTPGFEYKEDIETGSRAAAAGGYTFVNLMPNTKPVCSSAAQAAMVEQKAAEVGLCDVNQTVSITEDFDGKTIDHLKTLPASVKFITEDGHGVQDNATMARAFAICTQRDITVMSHAEDMEISPWDYRLAEDIETVLNSHVCIADSIVTEHEGRLVALVHFNRDEIESMIDDWREEWESKKEAWEAKTEQLKKEILDFVNAKVNRFSRISEVVEEKEDFIKTPTHKIKRFLYNKNKNGQTPDQPAAGK